MTILLLTPHPYQSANGTYTIPAGAVVDVFSAATEAGLIAAKLAAASVAAVTWTPPSDASGQGGGPLRVVSIPSSALSSPPPAGPAADPFTLYEIADGPNRGIKLTWSVPEGGTTPAWCWSFYPAAF